MRRSFKYLILFLCLISFVANSEKNSELNDGPYIFIEEDNLKQSNIVKGKVINTTLSLDAYQTDFEVEPDEYENIEAIAVLSDIHGQFDLAIELFKNNKIIDEDLNWSFANGHLVIVGDVFDRGPKVNETLWFLYKLEQQAKQNQGRVHLLLGNHEYMVLREDLRYIHEKYQQASDLLNLSYAELYGVDTVLGRWLRSKATIMKINNHTFVHGGISEEFLASKFDMEQTNKLMRESIDVEKSVLKSTGFYQKYYGSTGPIWYRGLILDDLGTSEISSILSKINSEHLVVGHCSDDKIVQLHDQKVFGVDSSIKNGKYGEILFIDKGENYFRATLKGEKIKLSK